MPTVFLENWPMVTVLEALEDLFKIKKKKIIYRTVIILL